MTSHRFTTLQRAAIGLGSVLALVGCSPDVQDVPPPAPPHALALSTYDASIGTLVEVYGTGFPDGRYGQMQLVLDGTDLVQRKADVGRQKLRENLVDGCQGERTGRKLDSAARRDHIRPFADMHDERFSIEHTTLQVDHVNEGTVRWMDEVSREASPGS